VTAPDDDAIEAIRARWRDAATLTDALLGAENDVAALLAALDAARAEAQRERERAEAAEIAAGGAAEILARLRHDDPILAGVLRRVLRDARRAAIEEAATLCFALAYDTHDGNDREQLESPVYAHAGGCVRALLDGPSRDVRRAAIEEAIARIESAHPTDVGPDGVLAILRALIDAPRSGEESPQPVKKTCADG
jgi:hypothetical protein